MRSDAIASTPDAVGIGVAIVADAIGVSTVGAEATLPPGPSDSAVGLDDEAGEELAGGVLATALGASIRTGAGRAVGARATVGVGVGGVVGTVEEAAGVGGIGVAAARAPTSMTYRVSSVDPGE